MIKDYSSATTEIIVALVSVVCTSIISYFIPKCEQLFRSGNARKIIFEELELTIVNLALTRDLLLTHMGSNNTNEFFWLLVLLKKHRTYCPPDMLTIMMNLSQNPNFKTEYIKYITLQSNISKDKYKDLKYISLPIIENNLTNMWIFKANFCKGILLIRAKIQILNQQIESSKDFSKLTFNPDIMRTNSVQVYTNINNSYKYIAIQIKEIILLIDRFLLKNN